MTARRSGSIGTLSLAVCLVLSGCQSLEVIAPVAAAPDPTGRVKQGRDLYLTRCTKCHAPEPVRDYSRTEWEGIIPEMAEETRLSLSETHALRAYILAVLNEPL